MKWIINIVNLIKNNKKMNEMKDKRKINPHTKNTHHCGKKQLKW